MYHLRLHYSSERSRCRLTLGLRLSHPGHPTAALVQWRTLAQTTSSQARNQGARHPRLSARRGVPARDAVAVRTLPMRTTSSARRATTISSRSWRPPMRRRWRSRAHRRQSGAGVGSSARHRSRLRRPPPPRAGGARVGRSEPPTERLRRASWQAARGGGGSGSGATAPPATQRPRGRAGTASIGTARWARRLCPRRPVGSPSAVHSPRPSRIPRLARRVWWTCSSSSGGGAAAAAG